MTTPWAYLDGEFLPEGEARISIADPALLYGRGLFETIRTYGGAPFRLAAHLDRLYAAAVELEITVRERRADFGPVIGSLTERAGLPDACVRITVTPAHTFATARALSMYPPGLYEAGARLVTWPHRRYSASPLVWLKTINYLEQLLARRYADARGAVDALILNEHGRVVEGSASNVLIVEAGGRVVTPPLSEGPLPGITRQVLLEILAEQGIPHAEEPFGPEALRAAREVLLSGSLKEVMPVAELDGAPVGGDRHFTVTRRLLEHYRGKVSAECGL